MRALTLSGMLILALAAMASADTIYLADRNLGWNTAVWGSGPSVPTAGNDYVVDGSDTSADTTRIDSPTFAGDSLRLEKGGKVIVNSSGSAEFLLDDGKIWHLSTDKEFTINGSIDVQDDGGILDAHKGKLVIGAPLSGSGALTVQDKGDDNESYVRLNGGGSYSGTITVNLVPDGTQALEATFGLGASLPNASITFSQGLYDLSGDVSVLGFTIDGVTLLEDNTYDAASLSDAGVSSFLDNGGTLTVVPEPATLGLLGLGGLVALRRRRRA